MIRAEKAMKAQLCSVFQAMLFPVPALQGNDLGIGVGVMGLPPPLHRDKMHLPPLYIACLNAFICFTCFGFIQEFFFLYGILLTARILLLKSKSSKHTLQMRKPQLREIQP